MILWRVDRGPALTCNGYGLPLESWLAGCFRKGNVHWSRRPGMCMYMVMYTGRECTYGGVHYEGANFLVIKLNNQKRTKVTCSIHY